MRQKRRVFEKIEAHYDGKLDGKTFALWGLSFKPSTDDMRAAPSRVIMESLWEVGATVRAYDPEAIEEAARIYPDQGGLVLCESAYDALEGADALVIVTEWNQFRGLDFERLKGLMTQPVLLDLRNVYEPATMRERGFEYTSVGR